MKSAKRLPHGPLVTGLPNKREEAVLDSAQRVDAVLVDLAHDSGAVGTLALGRKLPVGAIVTAVTLDIITAATSAGSATFQVLAGAVALTGAIAFDDATNGIDVVLAKKVSALAASATAIKLPLGGELKLAIAGAALTAGKVRCYIHFIMIN